MSQQLRHLWEEAAPDGNPREPSVRRSLYIVAEKVLARAEQLPESWTVHGTVGYEALNAINGLFVDRAQESLFSRVYERFIGAGARVDFRELLYDCKKLILQAAMSSEIAVLGHALDRISEKNRWSRDFTLRGLTDALTEVGACFPVYRTYIDEHTLRAHDRRFVELAVGRARRKNPATSGSVFDFVEGILLLRYPENAGEEARAAQRRFVGKFQQLTGPVMAKGLEDTAFYRYHRLLSLNEVGGAPEVFGWTGCELHRFFAERAARWPHALVTTATHDTKRGEDTRTRIDVLSELPREWEGRLLRWARWNRRHKLGVQASRAAKRVTTTNAGSEPGSAAGAGSSSADGLGEVPTRNDEWFLYQTLLGTWPLEAEPPAGPPVDRVSRACARRRVSLAESATEEYVARIDAYLVKALREAKAESSWVNPNTAYEEAMRSFVRAILQPSPKNRFLAELVPFARRVAELGAWSSLAQTLLKVCAPGAADVYQGSELWDLSLVDPDNRRTVDYERRSVLLQGLDEAASVDLHALVTELAADPLDARAKLFTLSRALRYRRSHRGLFTRGSYEPLTARGTRAEHVFAFARREAHGAVLVVVPRLVARLTGPLARPPLGREPWEDTAIEGVGTRRGRRYTNVLTGETLLVRDGPCGGELELAEILRDFPVALLEGS